ncbi:MAG: hypothetical protein AAGI34_08045 [Pseudomonadota bacterium]
MGDLDAALDRLDRAVDGLERVLGALAPPPEGSYAEERARLIADIARLEAAAERDAGLRTEAAEAVREALGEMRALLPEVSTRG